LEYLGPDKRSRGLDNVVGRLTLILVAALRADGVTAPYVIDGAMDGRAFLAYVGQVLAPTLKKRDVVMDNVRTHKVAVRLRTKSGIRPSRSQQLRSCVSACSRTADPRGTDHGLPSRSAHSI
jgi:hypothetical protein